MECIRGEKKRKNNATLLLTVWHQLSSCKSEEPVGPEPVGLETKCETKCVGSCGARYLCVGGCIAGCDSVVSKFYPLVIHWRDVWSVARMKCQLGHEVHRISRILLIKDGIIAFKWNLRLFALFSAVLHLRPSTNVQQWMCDNEYTTCFLAHPGVTCRGWLIDRFAD